MNSKLKKGLGAAGTLILGLAIVYIYFYPDFNHLNSKIIISDAGGDGLKAYYCYLYHIDHDSSFLKFDGMNYPYGESILYTDNQPLLSEVMRNLGNIFPGINNYSIGVWNFFILFSIAIGAAILFLVLSELGIPILISVLASLGIAFLSPQIDRIGAHYSLTYVFVIPLAIYLLLKFSKRQHIGYSIGIGCLMVWSGLTHMYFVAMVIMLIFLFWIYFIVTQPKIFARWKKLLIGLMVQIFLPILIIQFLDFISSDVTDRGNSPYGFLVYLAHPFSVFFPYNPKYGSFFHDLLIEKKIEWEGFSYVGIVAGIGFVFIIVKFFYYLIRFKFKTALIIGENQYLTYLFWGSILILLYSFGVPFIFGMEGLVEHLGPIQQIRSLGRFAWIFYYASNILVFHTLWEFQRKSGKKVIPALLIIISLIIILFEAHFNIEPKRRNYFKEYPQFTNYISSRESNPVLGEINPGEFQSILSLPYFHIGSEHLWKRPSCGIKEKSFEISLQTGLPLNAVMMGRTSLTQTHNSMELIWEPYKVQSILKDFPSDKPMLVLSAECDQLSKGEKLILKESKLIGKIDGFIINSITPKELKEMSIEFIQELYRPKDHNKIFSGFGVVSDTLNPFFYDNYYSLNNEPGFLSEGVKELPRTKYAEIFRDRLPVFTQTTNISISFWVKDIIDEKKPRLELEIATIGQNEKITKYSFASLGKKLVQISGEWGLVENQIMINPGEELSLVLIQTKDNSGVKIDDLLIRRVGTDVYGHNKNRGWMLNNHIYPENILIED